MGDALDRLAGGGGQTVQTTVTIVTEPGYFERFTIVVVVPLYTSFTPARFAGFAHEIAALDGRPKESVGAGALGMVLDVAVRRSERGFPGPLGVPLLPIVDDLDLTLAAETVPAILIVTGILPARARPVYGKLGQGFASVATGAFLRRPKVRKCGGHNIRYRPFGGTKQKLRLDSLLAGRRAATTCADRSDLCVQTGDQHGRRGRFAAH